MSGRDAFLAWLSGAPELAGARVSGWRVEIAKTESLRTGIRNSQLGGPYEAPGRSSRLSGSLVLGWSDGQVTRTRIDRTTINAPGAELAEWRALASSERRPPVFAPTAALPAVDVYDAALAEAVTRQPRELLELVGITRLASAADGARRLDATLRASSGRRSVTTSAGFHHTWDETACSLEVWIDEVTGASYARRQMLSIPMLAGYLDNVITMGKLLRHEDQLPTGARGVIFQPAAVEALLGRFMLRALAGRSIVDGRSPFSRQDLESARQVIRPDLDIVVDTTRPFELATAPCSSDGVAAGRVALIQDGRLRQPIVDPATAAELGLPPTPSPRGHPLLLLESRHELDEYGAGQALLGDGVVVRDLPGLHTQSAQRWGYALVVPDAAAVRDGRITGRVAARVRGNFLEHLRSASTRLLRVPGELNPAMLVMDGIVLDPA